MAKGGGSKAAIAESKKSRRQSNAFNARSLKAAQDQFKKSMQFQESSLQATLAASRVAPMGSDSVRDQFAASDEIARSVLKRQGFSSFRNQAANAFRLAA
jgi:hypothetical protein